MRTNSILPDPEPLDLTEDIPQPKTKAKKTDLARISSDVKYPDMKKFFEGRKEYFRRYLPNGTPIENLTAAERVENWNVACLVIAEIENLQAAIEGNIPRA